MAEAKHQEEPTLHEKRKYDLLREDEEINAKKIQKLRALNNNTSPVAEENGKNGDECEEENRTPVNSAVSEAKIGPPEHELAVEPENDEEEDEEDYEGEEEDDEDGEDSNGKHAVDRKGKGIMRNDKGKGKLIEEEDDDDDDDDSDSDDDSDLSQSEGESDLSDDPLTEVDLDNILPSRTRRRAAKPGFFIADGTRKAQDEDSDA